MNLQVDEPVFRWLLSLELCKSSDGKKLKNGKYQLISSISQSIETGPLVVKLLQSLIKKYNTPIPTTLPISLQINNIKQVASPSSRFYNWNLIRETLKLIGFNLDKETINLIAMGDLPMISDFLNDLYNFYKTSNKFINNNSLSIETVDLSKSMAINDNSKLIKSLPVKAIEAIELLGLQAEKPLKDTESLMEFFVLNLAQCFNLKPNQAATLLTKNTKYLSHVIAKGLKGEFEPVVSFYQSFVINKEIFLNFLQKEESKKSLSFILQALKAGLVSKDSEVAQWTLKTYEIFIEVVDVYDLNGILWAWLTEFQGIKSLFLCLKRHPELQDLILKVLIAYGDHKLYELFNEKLNGLFPDHKDLNFVLSRIISNLEGNNLTRKHILSSGALNQWISTAKQIISEPFDENNKNIANRVQAISLMNEIWKIFPLELQDKTNDFINLLKNNFAYKSQTMQSFIIIEMFNQLLTFFDKYGSQHNYIVLIYNLLIGLLIENFENTEIRSLISVQFNEAFTKKPTPLPPFLLLESLNIHLASLDIKNFQWNIGDFELMNTLANNDKIPVKSALIFLDLQAKIFLNNQIFARIACKPFLLVFMNNKSMQPVQEFVLKFFRTCLNVFMSLHKKPSLKEKKQKQLNSKKSIAEFSDQELKTLKSNKKAMIIEVLRDILFIAEENLKNRLTLSICQTIYQMKKYINKRPNKNLLILLGENAEKVFSDYEADYYQKLAKMRDEEKKNLEQNQQKMADIDNISRISGASSKDLNANALTFSLDLSNMPMSISKNSSFQRKMSLPSIDRYPSGKGKLSKADELKMNLLKNPKIDPKLRKKLLSLQEKRKEQLKSLDMTLKEQETKQNTRKIKLRRQVERKNKEQGVLAKNIKDHETFLTFPLDSLSKKNSPSTEIDNFQIVEENYLEDFQIKMLNEVVEDANSQRILKKVFMKYANIKERNKKPDTFEKISNISKTLSAVEMWAIIKELERLESESEEKTRISRVSNEILVKTVKTLVPKSNYFDEPVMDFQQYKRLIISLAKFLYKNEEIAIGLQRLLQKLEQLIMVSRNNSKEKIGKTNTNFEKDLNEINKKIQEDPEFVVPEGYRKEKQTKTILIKTLPEALTQQVSINQSYLIAYEILDEILSEKFNIGLIEKLSKEEARLVVKPIKPNKNNNATTNKSFALTTANENNQEVLADLKEPPKEKKKDKHKLKTETLAKTFEEKKKNQENLRLQSEKSLEAQKEQEKKKRENDKKRLEELQKNRMSFEQQMKAFWEKKHQENLEDKRFIQTQRKTRGNISPEEKAQREKSRKEFEEFNKKKLQEFREQFQKLISQRKKNEQDSISKSIVFTKKLKEFNEKILPKKFEEIREIGYEIKENQELISQSFHSPQIQEFFKEYEQTLQALFSFLISQTYTPLNFSLQRTTVPLQTLINFANEFNICPMLFKMKHMINFYKQITKNKPYSIDKVQVGLNYEEFLECLFRVAIKSNETLNKMCEFLAMGGHLKQKNEEEIDESKEKNENNQNASQNKPSFKEKKNKTNNILEKNKEILRDKYLNITKTNANTMVALLFYLGFPIDSKDKESTQQRLRDIISYRKIKPTKYRYVELQKKLDGEGYEILSSKKLTNKKHKKNDLKSKSFKTENDEELKLPKITEGG